MPLQQPPIEISYDEYVRLQLDRSRSMRHYDPGDRARYLIDVLARHLPPKLRPSPRVLCVGCRNGFELDHFQATGYHETVGIDLHSTDPRIRVMDMHRLDWPDESFDAVYSCHSLEHAYDPEAVGGEFVRVLRPGGFVLVEVPIHCERRKGDMWDLQSPEMVAALMRPCEIVWSEAGMQIGATQQVARVLVRVKP